eukprot:GHRR01032179.1.p1 GENE.GHRR01032179.1~~GHRR01032179.1.p1  ORF type:complete len:126 (+),score=33.44 GHRR01032179.1:297-674(+)
MAGAAAKTKHAPPCGLAEGTPGAYQQLIQPCAAALQYPMVGKAGDISALQVHLIVLCLTQVCLKIPLQTLPKIANQAITISRIMENGGKHISIMKATISSTSGMPVHTPLATSSTADLGSGATVH